MFLLRYMSSLKINSGRWIVHEQVVKVLYSANIHPYIICLPNLKEKWPKISYEILGVGFLSRFTKTPKCDTAGDCHAIRYAHPLRVFLALVSHVLHKVNYIPSSHEESNVCGKNDFPWVMAVWCASFVFWVLIALM